MSRTAKYITPQPKQTRFSSLSAACKEFNRAQREADLKMALNLKRSRSLSKTK